MADEPALRYDSPHNPASVMRPTNRFRLQTTCSSPSARVGHPFTINVPNFILIFMSILLEAMPFIVLGAMIAGLLEELLPQKLITRLLPRSRFLAIAIGGLLGLLFPMCECGIIPVMRRLLRRGCR